METPTPSSSIEKSKEMLTLEQAYGELLNQLSVLADDILAMEDLATMTYSLESYFVRDTVKNYLACEDCPQEIKKHMRVSRLVKLIFCFTSTIEVHSLKFIPQCDPVNLNEYFQNTPAPTVEEILEYSDVKIFTMMNTFVPLTKGGASRHPFETTIGKLYDLITKTIIPNFDTMKIKDYPTFCFTMTQDMVYSVNNWVKSQYVMLTRLFDAVVSAIEADQKQEEKHRVISERYLGPLNLKKINVENKIISIRGIFLYFSDDNPKKMDGFKIIKPLIDSQIETLTGIPLKLFSILPRVEKENQDMQSWSQYKPWWDKFIKFQEIFSRQLTTGYEIQKKYEEIIFLTEKRFSANRNRVFELNLSPNPSPSLIAKCATFHIGNINKLSVALNTFSNQLDKVSVSLTAMLSSLNQLVDFNNGFLVKRIKDFIKEEGSKASMELGGGVSVVRKKVISQMFSAEDVKGELMVDFLGKRKTFEEFLEQVNERFYVDLKWHHNECSFENRELLLFFYKIVFDCIIGIDTDKLVTNTHVEDNEVYYFYIMARIYPALIHIVETVIGIIDSYTSALEEIFVTLSRVTAQAKIDDISLMEFPENVSMVIKLSEGMCTDVLTKIRSGLDSLKNTARIKHHDNPAKTPFAFNMATLSKASSSKFGSIREGVRQVQLEIALYNEQLSRDISENTDKQRALSTMSILGDLLGGSLLNFSKTIKTLESFALAPVQKEQKEVTGKLDPVSIEASCYINLEGLCEGLKSLVNPFAPSLDSVWSPGTFRRRANSEGSRSPVIHGADETRISKGDSLNKKPSGEASFSLYAEIAKSSRRKTGDVVPESKKPASDPTDPKAEESDEDSNVPSHG